MYNIPRFVTFLITIILITGCSQGNQAANQNHTNQNAKNTESKGNNKASVEQSATKPLQGTVNGEPFQLDKASFKPNVDTLTLKQGEDYFPELAVDIAFLFREDSSQPPIGQHFKASCQENSNSGDKVSLFMSWKSDNNTVENKAIHCGYKLALKFGQKKGDNIIPAKLKLESKKYGINLSGYFDVKIKKSFKNN